MKIEIGDNLLSAIHHVIDSSFSSNIGKNLKEAFGIDMNVLIEKEEKKDERNKTERNRKEDKES